MKKSNLLFWLFIFTANIHAEIFNFARLDNTNGLSNNQIECIFKDSRGFMWFGTNFGLNRYDGNEFKIYKSVKNDTTSLVYNAISGIQEDIDGNLWISENPQYVIYNINTERFQRNLSPLLSQMGISFTPSIVEIDQNKNYYFYKQNVGVYKYDIKTQKLSVFLQGKGLNALSKGLIVGIHALGDSFWVIHQSGLLERMNEKMHMIDFRNAYIQSISAGASLQKILFVDNSGNPWVYPAIADKGVVTYTMKTGKWTYFGSDKKDFRSSQDQYITSDFVRALSQDKQGRIWIATDHGGINIFNSKTQAMIVLRNDPMNPNSISQNSTISLFSDNTGIMWVGTYKNGISYYHPGIFKFEKSPLFFYQNANLENKDCNTLLEDKNGNLWIGTNGSGLLKYENSSKQFHLFRNQKTDVSTLSSDIVISSMQDSRGDLWFGTFMGGLNKFVGNHFVRYVPEINNPNSIANKSVYGIQEDKSQNLWIATLGGGLDKLDPSRTKFTHYNSANTKSLSSNYILSLYKKDFSVIYLCTSQGVDVLNTVTGKINPVFKSTELRDKLSDLVIYNTIVDKRGFLWIATDNGINIYDPQQKKISYLNMTNGLPSEQVVSLIEDNRGTVWAGTRNGLASITYKKDDAGNDFVYNVISFDENDGLVSSIFNQNAVFKNKQGLIYIGSTKGYTVFDPKTIRFNQTAPVPRFTSLLISNEEIVPGKKFRGNVILEKSITDIDKLELKYTENNFTLKFSALSYIHPEKNKYRYMLKGFDDKWYELKSGDGQVTYSNLNQGSYQLIIYASNNDNVWSKDPLTLEIVIKPPFWLSWWAFLFYIILTMTIVWYIVNFNLRKQQLQFESERKMQEAKQMHEIDEMKFRFFTNVSHEFRTPLTLILSPVEKLLKSAKSEEERSLLEIVHRNAGNLLDLVNQLLDFRKLDVQKDTLHLSVGDVVSFIKEVCYSFTEMANQKEINFSFSTSVSELRMEFDPEKLRKVVYNLLSNAFKFTDQKGKIDVAISMVQQMNTDEKTLKVVVSDTGCGIPADAVDRIFERFYRVENKENGHRTGTGVGLHIVSEYVKLHKGHIHVESKLDEGSVFTLTFPVKEFYQEEIIASTHSDQLTTESTEEPVATENNDQSKTKLPLMLVVDDNADFRKFISSLFTANYRIIEAGDGEQALKIILSKMPDLIISDLMMPKMDGYELCRKVKQDIRISHIPIILLTAKAGDENKYRGLEAGAEDYIAKPFNMEMLSLKVSRIIERQQKLQEQFRKKVDINPSEIEITSMDEKFVKKAVSLVEDNIDNTDFLVEDLCREMGMSRVYFYKKILSLTDKTPSEFIRFIRLKRAADLLEKSQMYVNEVAYQVGFNDPKYFRKYFKEEFGMSPNDYKKKFERPGADI